MTKVLIAFLISIFLNTLYASGINQGFSNYNSSQLTTNMVTKLIKIKARYDKRFNESDSSLSPARKAVGKQAASKVQEVYLRHLQPLLSSLNTHLPCKFIQQTIYKTMTLFSA